MARDFKKIATLTSGRFTESTKPTERGGWLIFVVPGPILLALGGAMWLSCMRTPSLPTQM